VSDVPSSNGGPVYVGLGANLGDPERTLSAAAEAIAHLPDVELRRRSSLYAAAPIGPEQPEFRNAERWGPRVLDLDILLWGDRVVDQPGLHVPHPELQHRRFALEPLAELDPAARHPVLQKTVAELLAAVRDQPVQRLDSVLWRPR